MEIRIKEDGSKLLITDDGFNAPGFVSLITTDQNDEAVIDTHITQLYPVVKMFYDKYVEDLKIDKLKRNEEKVLCLENFTPKKSREEYYRC